MTLRTMAAFMKASKESTPVAKALADDDSATGKFILDTLFTAVKVFVLLQNLSLSPTLLTFRQSGSHLRQNKIFRLPSG